jgi:hypothetical protein
VPCPNASGQGKISTIAKTARTVVISAAMNGNSSGRSRINLSIRSRIRITTRPVALPSRRAHPQFGGELERPRGRTPP